MWWRRGRRIERRLTYLIHHVLDLEQQVRDLTRLTRLLNAQEHIIMADLSTLADSVAANGDVVDSAITLLNGLYEQLQAAGTDPAAIAALADELKAQTDALAAAVAANTPVAPAPVEPPVEPV